MIDWAAWRTFAFGLISLVAIVAAIWLKASDGALRELASAATWMVGALAGRSAIQALAQGGGVKGATATLMTETKPEGGQ